MTSEYNLRATMEATVRSFLRSPVDATRAQDLRLVTRDLTRDCKRQVLPRTFQLQLELSTPDERFDNAHTERSFRENAKVCAVRATEIHSLTIDETARRAAARTSTVVCLPDRKEMELETCWFLDLVQDGTRIKGVTEFVGENAALRKHRENARWLGLRKELNATLIG
ncbi:hypothetical protein GGR51DRAFT_189431 [Nemania sp. FL0031]|nr:hypothetical protein GGR51DRAFT_189431 [Nemania sp. FL0031]